MKKKYSCWGKLPIIILIGIVLLGSITISSGAIVPPKKKELVYGLSLFNGKEFASTFCPRSADTIFMLANVNNVFSFKRTEVYYWPITEEYMADWFSLNEDTSGTMEILQGKKVIKVLEKMKHTYVYPQGYFGPTNLVLGDDAEKEYQAYKKKMDEYWDAVSQYYKKTDEWRKIVNEIVSGKRKGKVPPEPERPEPPSLYVVEPALAFILNLPEGEYSVRVKDEKGRLRIGSEKKLVAFTHMKEGIGYQIIPAEKWTYPVNCDDLRQVIYFTDKVTLFLKVFNTRQYNEYQYVKLSKLHAPFSGKGREYGKGWVQLDSRKDVLCQLLKDGKVVATINERPYYVEQSPGYALGYEIVDFDKEKYPYGSPTFEATKIEVDKPGRYEFRLIDNKDGKVLSPSIRTMRAVKSVHANFLYLLTIFPLVIGGAVFGWRRSLLPRGPR